MKTALKLLLLLALVVYLIMAITKFNTSDSKATCRGVELIVSDSAKASFITSAELSKELKKKNMHPQGKRLDFIDGRKIEETLEKNPFIEKAQCVKTAADIVKITVTQRLPILRIMTVNGDDYYVDAHGRKMSGVKYAADLVVVTGYADYKYVRRYLVSLGLFLQQNNFWNDQIEQLNVTSSGDLEMIPRVGEQIVLFGKPKGLNNKFKHLELFYKKVMNEVGWNKYTVLNLEFDNQIICTKKELEI